MFSCDSTGLTENSWSVPKWVKERKEKKRKKKKERSRKLG